MPDKYYFMIFTTTIKQVALLFVYITAGIILVKTKLLNKNASKTLSALLTFFIGPLYTIHNLSQNIKIEELKLYGNLLLYGTIFVVLLVAFSYPLSRLFSKDPIEKGIYSYLFAFSNYGYFGYPLVEGVFGAKVLAEFMIFCLPISIVVSSYGYYMLTSGARTQNKIDAIDGRKIHWKKYVSALYNPPMIGTYIGLLLAFLPITVPNLVYEFLAPAVKCYSAIPMLIAGIVLGGCKFKSLFNSWKAYVTGFISLVIKPLLFGALAYLLYRFLSMPREAFIGIFVFCSIPCGMNVIVYPESVGLDSSMGAKSCFLSYIMAIVTIPIAFTILEALVGAI